MSVVLHKNESWEVYTDYGYDDDDYLGKVIRRGKMLLFMPKTNPPSSVHISDKDMQEILDKIMELEAGCKQGNYKDELDKLASLAIDALVKISMTEIHKCAVLIDYLKELGYC